MNNNYKIRRLTLAAILTAIILVMTFTPLGYLRVGLVSITFLTVPVVLGGIVLGPVWGGILGAVFGLTSFAQCFMGDPFGAALVSINMVATFTACLVPRILIGVVTGLLYPVLRKFDAMGIWSAAVTTLAGSLTNTVFFVGMVTMFFRNSYAGFQGLSIGAILLTFYSVNIFIEAAVCCLLGVALSKALQRVQFRELA